MERKKYILVRRVDDNITKTLDYVETDVNQYLEEGYVLAGPLVYQTNDDSEYSEEWHIAIQPMMLKEDI